MENFTPLSAAIGGGLIGLSAVILLPLAEALSTEETAEALGISRASVKTRLLRARLMLRDMLAPGFGGAWFARLPFEKGSKPW